MLESMPEKPTYFALSGVHDHSISGPAFEQRDYLCHAEQATVSS